MLRLLFSPRGRIGNVAYALSQAGLLPLLLSFSAGRDALVAGTLPPYAAIPLIVLGFIVIWVSFAVLAKRLHDAGLSVWWWGVPIVAAFAFRPLLYAATIGMAFVAGDASDNRFGPPPPGFRAWRLKILLRRLGRRFTHREIDAALYNKTRAGLIADYLSSRG